MVRRGKVQLQGRSLFLRPPSLRSWKWRLDWQTQAIWRFVQDESFWKFYSVVKRVSDLWRDESAGQAFKYIQFHPPTGTEHLEQDLKLVCRKGLLSKFLNGSSRNLTAAARLNYCKLQQYQIRAFRTHISTALIKHPQYSVNSTTATRTRNHPIATTHEISTMKNTTW